MGSTFVHRGGYSYTSAVGGETIRVGVFCEGIGERSLYPVCSCLLSLFVQSHDSGLRWYDARPPARANLET
jgi:hypothetical protein